MGRLMIKTKPSVPPFCPSGKEAAGPAGPPRCIPKLLAGELGPAEAGLGGRAEKR